MVCKKTANYIAWIGIGQNLNMVIAMTQVKFKSKLKQPVPEFLVGIGKISYLVSNERVAIKQLIGECWLEFAKIWNW